MTKQMQQKKHGAYIVTVDMGYGHQRAVYPLKDIAAAPLGARNARIISANNYEGIPASDRRIWESTRRAYEAVSRMKQIPLIGGFVFGAMDRLQQIDAFYPVRDLSEPTLQVRQIYRLIEKGWGKALIDLLNQEPLPYVTSFFTTAFFAEEHGYKGQIYCLCTDTDISRAWAPLHPKTSRIIYFAPNKRVRRRLESYGVKPDNIFVTGFPLPKENIGGNSLKVLKESLGSRLQTLDPTGKFHHKYRTVIEHFLGKQYVMKKKAKHPLTITFAVGGAGAQREIGIAIARSLRTRIRNKEVILQLVAGVRREVYEYYETELKKIGLLPQVGRQIKIIAAMDKQSYFENFNQALLRSDILWTKPSELSFYAGLGLPIIMAPTIGSQEEYNRSWLHSIGAGFEQENPEYTEQWLFDWIESGWLAQAALEGFLNAPRMGAYHVEDIVLKGKVSEIEDIHLL